MIDPAQEQVLKAHSSEYGRLFPGMTERVNLPDGLWGNARSESVVEELETERHLVDYVHVGSGRFVIHAPASSNEFQLSSESNGEKGQFSKV